MIFCTAVAIVPMIEVDEAILFETASTIPSTNGVEDARFIATGGAVEEAIASRVDVARLSKVTVLDDNDTTAADREETWFDRSARTEESEDTVAVVEERTAVFEAREDKVIEVEANADCRSVVFAESVLNWLDKDERVPFKSSIFIFVAFIPKTIYPKVL